MRLTYRYMPAPAEAGAKPRRLVSRSTIAHRRDERARVMRWEAEGGALARPAAGD